MIRFVIFFVLCFLLMISCSQSDLNQTCFTSETEIGSECLNNSGKPQKGSNFYVLNEELTIGINEDQKALMGTPVHLVIDRHNNIYVADYQRLEIFKFSSKGEFIKKFAGRGKGPGEILIPSEFILDHTNDIIYIFDSLNNKITTYNTDGVFIKDISLDLKNPIGLFLIPNKFYYILNRFIDDNSSQKCKIIKYSLNGAAISTSNDFLLTEAKLIKKGNSTRTGGSIFDPSAYFTCDSNGNIFYAFSDQYKFTIYNPDFKKIKTVKRINVKPVKLPKEEIEKYIAYEKDKAKRKGKPTLIDYVLFPEYYPFFKGFWIDDKDRLIIRTPSQDSNEHLDIFSKEGVYQEEIILRPPSDGIQLKWILWRPVFKSDYIYCIVLNQYDQYVIKKYRSLRFNGK